MHRSSVKERAVRLREQGYSYSHISKEMGLSKSTLSGWLAAVPYVPNSATIASFGRARAAAAKRKAETVRSALIEIRKEAVKEIGETNQRDLFMFGLGLYMGEGAKTHGGVNLANADPRVISLAVEWFRSIGIGMEQFAPRIHIYPDNNVRQCIKFWSKSSGIPVSQFKKTYIDRRIDKKSKKTGKLPFGTLYLTVRSRGRKEHGVALFRKIQAWNEVVLENTKRG